jgi:aryl-alcohol dehydrogenase-like predicted oxidoreductase
MEYRKLGNTDIEISTIAFGAWAIGGWMWGGADRKDAIEAMEKSFDLGITSFDTAPAYGFGVSESLVGEASQGKRDKVQILTKYGLRWDTTKGKHHFDSEDNEGNPIAIHKYAAKENVIKECEESLWRLRTDYIDLYQIHWPDPTTPIEETMEAIEILLKEGKIRAAGVCNYSAEQVATASKVVPIVSNQVPYSMVNRGIEKEVVPHAINNNQAILAYSPLQRGLLTGKITQHYEFESGDHRANMPHFKKENVAKVNLFLDEIKPIADGKGATLAQLVIAWTLQQPGITCALVGARNAKQTEENAKAASIQLSDEEIQTINDKLDNLKLEL